MVTERQNDSMAVAGQLKSPLLFLEEYYTPERFLKFENSGATRKQIGAISNFTAYQIFGKKIKK